MIKIGITGSIASGKTTASEILSRKRGPLFSADKEVKKLYKNKSFQRLLIKKFNIKKKTNVKNLLKKIILKNKTSIKKLEKIIHPLIRKKMKDFSRKNKKKKNLFYEIPLLVENKLMKHFNVIIFLKAKKWVRLKRFKLKGGEEKLFNLMNNRQLSDTKKIKYCDHVIDNEKNLNTLKKDLLNVIRLYA
jgi:dephospho-CoA kinase